MRKEINRARRARALLSAVPLCATAGAALLPALLTEVAAAQTFTWTRGGTNNNWDTASNWSTGSGVGAPPVTGADLRFAGTQLNANATSAMRQSYAVNSITITEDYDHAVAGSSQSLSTSSTLLTGQTTAHLTVGAGGITVNQKKFNVGISKNSAAQAADLIVAADQTWATNFTTNAANATLTFTISRNITGSASVTKTGPGTLVLVAANTGYSGNWVFNEGIIRTGGLTSDHNNHFGSGSIVSTSNSDVTITASTVNSNGGDRRFANDLVLGGTGRLTFGGSFNLGFTADSDWQLTGTKDLATGFVTDHLGTLSGTGGWRKLGGGTVVLNNSASYAGSTTIADGILRVRNATALGTGPAPVAVTGPEGTFTASGSLELDGGAAGLTLTGKPLALSGTGPATVNASNTAIGAIALGGALRNLSGNNTWSGPVTLTGPSATIRIEAGSLALPAGITSPASNLNLTSAATGGTLSTLHVQIGGTLTVGDGIALTATSTSTVADVNRVAGLTLAGTTSTFDLRTNDLIVDAGNLAAIAQAIRDNRLRSSVAGTTTADPRSAFAALGVLSNDIGGNIAYYDTFDGQPVSADDILVKYTYRGDTDLNGKLDAFDYARIVEGLTTAKTGWSYGDINYDGTIDLTDWTLFTAAYAAYSTPFPGGGSGGASEAGSVPEPTSTSLLLLSTLPLLRRPKRH